MDPTQDTFNESVSSLLERRVRRWLGGVIDDMRRSSPVQQWLDSLPPDVENETTNAETTVIVSNLDTSVNNITNLDTTVNNITNLDTTLNNITNSENTVNKSDPEQKEEVTDENKPDDSVTENTVVENNVVLHEDNLVVPEKDMCKRKSLDSGLLASSSPSNKSKSKLKRDYSVQSEGCQPRFKNPLLRDHSLQSDGSGSSGSSVLNVLGARKVDAESVLLALGFGPSERQQKLQRIPDRFLAPSKMKGISTEQFIKDEQHSMRMHDCGIFGYRGLTGNPHVPPSTIVAKIMECIIQDDVCREEALMKARHSFADLRSSAAVPKQTRLRST